MPQIDESVWGQISSFTTFATFLNKRSGTNDDITNIDYTNFKPFVNLPVSIDNQNVGLYTIYANGNLPLNQPIDESVCYVGMYNSELPQLNIGVYYAGDTQENPTFKTDNTQIQSFFLYDNFDLYYAFGNQNYIANGQLPVPDVANYSEYVYWSPNAQTTEYPNKAGYNGNLRMDVLPIWGIKSFFLVIYVVYISSWDNSGQPISSQTTLNDYLNGVGHDDTWKTQHPVMCAFGMPYIRRSTNGLYNSQLYDDMGVIPALTLPYSGEYDGQTYDIYSYVVSCMREGNSVPNIGYFPIYGSITPWRYNYPYGAITNQYGQVMLGIDKGVYKKSPSNEVYWFELDLTDPDNVEYLMRGCAAYGLYFSDDYYTLNQAGRDTDRWYDEKMCCGTIDEQGRTNGDYTRGLYNLLQRQNNWSDSTESPFDPSITPTPTDNTQYSDSTNFRTLIGTATFNKQYAITDSTMLALSLALTESMSLIPPNVSAMDYSLSTFLTNNPLDCIISLRKYPVYSLVDSGTDIPIYFGAYVNANVKGIPCNTTIEHIVFTFKYSTRNSLYPHFGDFRDFEPYTRAELVIPFCGSIPLTCADFMGHDINVHMFIDYITGLATAYIAADNLVMSSVSGSIGIDIPLTGVQSATLQSQRVNAVMQRKNAELAMGSAVTGALTSSIGTLASISTGNVIGGVASGAGLVSSVSRIQQSENAYDKADYDLKHMQVPFKEVQAGSPLAADCMEYDCRLLIYRPVMADNYDPESYAKTVGFACLESGKVSQFTGLTVGNINTGGLSVTETEKRQIEKLFANGVIL